MPQGRQQALRSGPCYVLQQGIPCSLAEPQLRCMAEGAAGLDYVNLYNPCDPGFAVFVFRTEPGVHVSMHAPFSACTVRKCACGTLCNALCASVMATVSLCC